MEASLGNALARLAVAWRMTFQSQPDSASADRLLTVSPLISFFTALLRVQRKATASPMMRATRRTQHDDSTDHYLTHSGSKVSLSSLSPFKTPKALSSFSLDFNGSNRSRSSYRMETERVERLTRYCESVERKVQWSALRERKEEDKKRLVKAREEEGRRQFLLDRSFQEQLQAQARQRRLEERKDRDQAHFSTREAKAKIKRDEVKRVQDDLQRSVFPTQIEAHSLSQFSKSLNEVTRRKEKEEKVRENKEFLVALKRSTAARKIVPEYKDPEVDLAFQLHLAVLKNQEVVKQIVTSSHMPL